MLSLEPWTLFWTVFNVLVLFLAMKKFLLKPVMGVIEKREAMIRQQFDEAENAKNQAQAMKEAYTKQLETAHAPADAAGLLLQQALDNGGRDNITLLILQVESRKTGFWQRLRKLL